MLGLKAGIYTDAGKDGCGFYYPTGSCAPGGSEGHYEQDFLQSRSGGFDFVKSTGAASAEHVDPRRLSRHQRRIKKASAQTTPHGVLGL